MIIREATLTDRPAIARVHVDSWRTTYGGILPQKYLDDLSYEQRESQWQQCLDNSGYFIYVAEDESGQVVGFACGGAERTGDPIYQGELTALYILQDFQQAGVGRQLVTAVAARLAQMGLNTMLVWALQDNPACGFYGKLGGKQLRQRESAIDQQQFIEIAYGWTDITVLRQ
jgi:GNAT superfamily N-acetyltransferase